MKNENIPLLIRGISIFSVIIAFVFLIREFTPPTLEVLFNWPIAAAMFGIGLLLFILSYEVNRS
jgi:hypothetical protein